MSKIDVDRAYRHVTEQARVDYEAHQASLETQELKTPKEERRQETRMAIAAAFICIYGIVLLAVIGSLSAASLGFAFALWVVPSLRVFIWAIGMDWWDIVYSGRNQKRGDPYG